MYAPTIVRLPGQKEPGKEDGEGEGASYEGHSRVGTRRIRQVPRGEVGRMRKRLTLVRKERDGETDNDRIGGRLEEFCK